LQFRFQFVVLDIGGGRSRVVKVAEDIALALQQQLKLLRASHQR
jgi:hypothetical protein